jgi:hypothetical protein
LIMSSPSLLAHSRQSAPETNFFFVVPRFLDPDDREFTQNCLGKYTRDFRTT